MTAIPCGACEGTGEGVCCCGNDKCEVNGACVSCGGRGRLDGVGVPFIRPMYKAWREGLKIDLARVPLSAPVLFPSRALRVVCMSHMVVERWWDGRFKWWIDPATLKRKSSDVGWASNPCAECIRLRFESVSPFDMDGLGRANAWAKRETHYGAMGHGWPAPVTVPPFGYTHACGDGGCESRTCRTCAFPESPPTGRPIPVFPPGRWARVPTWLRWAVRWWLNRRYPLYHVQHSGSHLASRCGAWCEGDKPEARW